MPLTHRATGKMHCAFRILLIFWIVQEYTARPSEFGSTRVAHSLNFNACHKMQGRPQSKSAVKGNAPQAVGFKCAHCGGEFGSRRAMDCHRRHATSIGTPCADPNSSKSLSVTGRADMSTGILRQHDAATLGAWKRAL